MAPQSTARSVARLAENNVRARGVHGLHTYLRANSHFTLSLPHQGQKSSHQSRQHPSPLTNQHPNPSRSPPPPHQSIPRPFSPRSSLGYSREAGMQTSPPSKRIHSDLRGVEPHGSVPVRRAWGKLQSHYAPSSRLVFVPQPQCSRSWCRCCRGVTSSSSSSSLLL